MSIHSIHQYQNEVEKIIHYGGTKKETAIRNAFYNLLNEYAKQRGLILVTEVTTKASNGKNVTPDGTLKDMLRQDWGYWESKDESDDIDEEIQKKFGKGYPKENILFEDSVRAVLIQNGIEIDRVSMKDSDELHNIITAFINFERPEVRHFRKAIELFKQDIPKVTETLRGIIIDQEKTNPQFITASETFLKLCHDSINPNIINEDVREMIIQHILTEDVFNTIFDENQFHRENNIARELESVIHTFFTGSLRKTALATVQHYYQAINAAAAGIADHHEKQKFLKVIYETFYKSYNPKAADRLGVIYTPNEIVQFMIKSTDYLLNKHFNKFLEDKGVEILDPATGTGTFICDMIDYMGKDRVEYKYNNELHANEVAILPYYISNLNIEFTYTQKMGKYKEFENLCFVDTLDNMGFAYRGKQIDMFSPFTEENTKRIKKQNDKKIAVVIGNPPYNANQSNENENNKNRQYPEIDKRIKETYIKYSTAQKTKQYDMYKRFVRWSSDRLNENGVLAFITNRAYIDSKQDDGFRKCLQMEFDYAYIIDTKSDVRANPKIAGTTHNVFGIQTGIAIMFLIKKSRRDNDQCNIQYISLDDFWKKEEKLQWLTEKLFKDISFTHIQPDTNNNWTNISDNDFETLLPLATKDVKLGRSKKAIFESFSLGVATNRDEWVYDFDLSNLQRKIEYFSAFYNKEVERWNSSQKDQKLNDFVNREIKWTSELELFLKKGKKLMFDKSKIRKAAYRCFVSSNLYFDKIIIHRTYQNEQYFGIKSKNENLLIALNTNGKLFNVLATNLIPNNHFNGDSQCIPFYNYDVSGERTDNITDWGFNQFVKRYGRKGVTKETIFHYVYAVLHNPEYRIKYELNLKRELPRIPFYQDFKRWAEWGKRLMDLHINYESIEPYSLEHLITTYEVTNTQSWEIISKPKLKADKTAGKIYVDGFDTLQGIPPIVWEYKLGNRSALEWILDQYKESKPKDPTIAERFNTYRFADHKDKVIDLLKRVCTVSLETMKIINLMRLEYEREKN
jgi:predicted helicase